MPKRNNEFTSNKYISSKQFFTCEREGEKDRDKEGEIRREMGAIIHHRTNSSHSNSVNLHYWFSPFTKERIVRSFIDDLWLTQLIMETKFLETVICLQYQEIALEKISLTFSNYAAPVQAYKWEKRGELEGIYKIGIKIWTDNGWP